MKWVTIYGNAQSKVLPHPATYAKDLTLRYPLYIPFSGNKVRITLDNYCSDNICKIDFVTISLGDSLSDKQCEIRYLTFSGNKSVEIEAHGFVVSDPIDFDCIMDKYLIVSMYFKDYVDLTSGIDIIGPLSKGYFAYGNQIENEVLDINTSKSTSWVYFLANVDIYTEDENYAIICYGDSITSQDWPDYLMLEIKKRNINNVAVIRKAVSGTRILRQYECITYQSYGFCGKNRFNHEISSVSGAKKLIIQQGINDIIHPVGIEKNIFRPMSDLPNLEELSAGMKYYLDEAKRYNLDTYVGTLLPIFNWRTFELFREDLKNSFNEWIMNNTSYIDFNNQIGEPLDGIFHFKNLCDSGDHLHPSKYAYNEMAICAFKKLFS